MNFSVEDDEQENLYFPTNFNRNSERKPKSRLGRRKINDQYVTHPVSSLSHNLGDEIKHGEALRDIANILKEPNPVLNDSFVSDLNSSSSNSDSRTSGFSETLKTPGRSFYLPSADDSPVNPLKGESSLDSRKGDSFSFFQTISKQDLLPTVTTSNDRSIEKSHDAASSFKNVSGMSASKLRYTAVIQGSCLSTMKERKVSDLNRFTEPSPFTRGRWCSAGETVVRDSFTDKESDEKHDKIALPSLLLKKNEDPDLPSVPLKPIPGIEKIAKNFSSHFSNSTPKEINNEAAVDECKKEACLDEITPLDRRQSGISLGREVNHASIPDLLEKPIESTKPYNLVESSTQREPNPMSSSSLSQPTLFEPCKTAELRNIDSDEVDGLLPHRHLSVSRDVLKLYSDEQLSSCKPHSKRDATSGNLQPFPISNLHETPIQACSLQDLAGYNHRVNYDARRVRSNSLSNGSSSDSGNIISDQLKHKHLSASVGNVNYSIKREDGGLPSAHSRPTSYRIKNSPDNDSTGRACFTPSMRFPPSSSSVIPSGIAETVDVNCLVTNKPEKKSKLACNLFQASFLKNENSIIEGTKVPNSVGCKSSLFQSSIIKSGKENVEIDRHTPDLVSRGSLFVPASQSSSSCGDSVLKCDILSKDSEKPSRLGSLFNISSGPTKKEEPVVKKLPQENEEVFKKPCIVPRQIKPSQNLQNKVYVNGVAYPILSLLGRGGSSKVYQSLKDDNTLVAIKCVDLQSVDQSVASGYLNEISLLEALQCCPSVIKMFNYDYQKDNKKLLVVLEKGEIDFANLMKSIPRTKDMAPMIIYYWTEMLNCVNDIHKKGVIHSDLKPANFLLVKGRLKLIDFGIASSLQDDMTSVLKDVTTGTFNYMSPEAIIQNSETAHGHKISYKSDVWSLGCILYQLLYGRTPYSHFSTILAKIQAIADPKCLPTYSQDVEVSVVMKIALRWCLMKNPKMRPKVQELLDLFYHEYNYSCSNSQFRAVFEKMFPHCPVSWDF